MLHRLLPVCACLPLLLVLLPAQRPVPRYSLTAGRHDLGDLVEVLGQIAGAPLRVDAETARELGQRELVLQRELRLDAATWQDVASGLLFEVGFTVAPSAAPEADRLVSLSEIELLVAAAAERTAAEVLARPDRIGWVRVAAPSPVAGTDGAATGEPLPVGAVLRPLLMLCATPWALRVIDDERGTWLVGPSDQVGLALRLLAVLRGEALPERSPVRWSTTGELPWPGGASAIAGFVDALCTTLDANVVGSIPEGRVDLGAATTLTPREWFARATRVLHAHGLSLAPLTAEHRVFALLPARGPEIERRFAGAPVVTSDEVPDQGAGIQPVIVLHRLQRLEPAKAHATIRGLGVPGVLVAMLGTDHLYVAGLTDSVAPVVAALRAAELGGGPSSGGR